MRHTPGPWFLELNKADIEIWNVLNPRETTVSKPGKLIASLFKTGPIAELEIARFLPTPDQTVANAELLVRAPRLLEALKNLHYELSPMPIDPREHRRFAAWEEASRLVAELEKVGVL